MSLSCIAGHYGPSFTWIILSLKLRAFSWFWKFPTILRAVLVNVMLSTNSEPPRGVLTHLRPPLTLLDLLSRPPGLPHHLLLLSSPSTSLCPTGKRFLFWCPTLLSGWDPKWYLFCLIFQIHSIILSFTEHRVISGDEDQVGSNASPWKHQPSSDNPSCWV